MVDEINYLGAILDNTRDWNKENDKLRAKGIQNLVHIKCLARNIDIKVKILEIVQEIITQSK